MTDETRAELRRGIEAVVRGMGLKDAILVATEDRAAGADQRAAEVTVYLPDEWPVRDLAPLTTGQHLALSVLLGEVSGDVLADYMIDQGHEYAVAVADKARAEERERIRQILRQTADTASADDDSHGVEMMHAVADRL